MKPSCVESASAMEMVTVVPLTLVLRGESAEIDSTAASISIHAVPE